MSINFGEGGSAKCVLVPPFKCSGIKINNINNYVSKIALLDIEQKDSIENYILFNEYNIGEYLRKNVSKSKINKYYSLVEFYCILNYDEFDDKTKNECNLEPSKTYIILYSRNGSCNTLKVNDNIIVNNNNAKITRILHDNMYEININKYTYKINKNDINRYCGNLSNYYSYYMCFNTLDLFRKNMKHLINGLALLSINNIVHTDIKLDNIVCDKYGHLRIIDYGGAINLKDNFNKSELCLLLDKNIEQKKKLYNTIKTYTHGYVPPEVIIFLKIMYYDIYNLPVNMFDIIDELNKFKFNEDLSYLINLIIENKQYLYNNFFCNETLIFKFDIYSLGIVFKKIYEDIKKNINIYDSNLEDLINNMTNLNYEKRLTYNQIRTHDFFKKSLSKGKPMNKKLKLKKTKKK